MCFFLIIVFRGKKSFQKHVKPFLKSYERTTKNSQGNLEDIERGENDPPGNNTYYPSEAGKTRRVWQKDIQINKRGRHADWRFSTCQRWHLNPFPQTTSGKFVFHVGKKRIAPLYHSDHQSQCGRMLKVKKRKL